MLIFNIYILIEGIMFTDQTTIPFIANIQGFKIYDLTSQVGLCLVNEGFVIYSKISFDVNIPRNSRYFNIYFTKKKMLTKIFLKAT